MVMNGGGSHPIYPRLMTKLLIYAYCVGAFSSRRMERRMAEDIAFKVLAADNEPDFRTISDFRKTHLTVQLRLRKFGRRNGRWNSERCKRTSSRIRRKNAPDPPGRPRSSPSCNGSWDNG
jgi:hypothetical protein